MKTAAIICEYNPFHFGHNYQIKELRRRLGEDTIVVSIMSGAFTQRGEPAVFDKFMRAAAAVGGGKNTDKIETFCDIHDSGYADLVLELPAPWSMSGAEFFANAGVSLAKRIGVDHLVFGGESELSELQKIAENLNSSIFKENFAKAREENSALSTNALREKIYRQLFSAPMWRGSNDILAIEYLRVLGESKIEPICIKRVGEKYNPDGKFLSNTEKFSSASTIRQQLYSEISADVLMPIAAAEILKSAKIHRIENLDSVVTAYLRFNYQNMDGIEVSGGIENKLHRAAMSNFGVEKIVDSSVERRFSASRIKRAIFGAMCGFSARDYEEIPEYTQLLAANRRGCDFLAERRKKCDLCILTKSANYRKMSESAKKQFEANFRAEALWALSSDDESDRRADELMRRNPFIF